jgi:hypothetical protein
MELDELNDFFASDETRNEDDEGPETDPRALKPTPLKPSEPRRRRRVAQPNGEEDDAPGPAPGPDPVPNPNPQPNPNPGPNPRRRRVAEPIVLDSERNIVLAGDAPTKRRLMFTVPVNGNVNITVEASGLSTPEWLSIVRSSCGEVANGGVTVACEARQRVSLDVEFDTPYSGPIEISAVRMDQPEEEAAK